jgi:hypothetical protein
MGNYNAVYSCSGSMDDKKATAKQISDTREWAIFGGGADSAGDQEANLFGRNGGSCASRYLKNVRCAYNPATKQCKWWTVVNGATYYIIVVLTNLLCQ